MSKRRKADLEQTQHIMKTLNTVVKAAADQAGEFYSNERVEGNELDGELMIIYTQAIDQLREGFRILSTAEERLKPIAEKTGKIWGIFSRA